MGVKVSDRNGHISLLNDYYEKALRARGKVPIAPKLAPHHSNLISDLEQNHFGVFQSNHLVGDLSRLKLLIDGAFADPSRISTPKHSCFKVKSSTDSSLIEEIDSMPRLCPSEVAEGPDFWRRHTSYVQIRDPLTVIPELLPVLLEPALIAVMQEYLGAFPQLNFVKVQRTWANSAPEIDTQLWHVDLDARKLMKVFIFLHDVDEARGGTKFVEGSHFFDGHVRYTYRDRWSEQEIADQFGAEAVSAATCDFGDLFMMDTNMIHRGSRPQLEDRTVIIANFGIHEETVSGGSLRVMPSSLENLFPWQLRVLPQVTPE
jgi:hypothetical protein